MPSYAVLPRPAGLGACRAGFGQEAGEPRATNIAEWFGAQPAQPAHPLAGFFGLRADVAWHGPCRPHSVELFPVPYSNVAVGGTQNVQLEVDFLDRVVEPAHGKDDVDVDHGIDGVEAGRPEGAAGNHLDERHLEHAGARAIRGPPRAASGDA